jgi:hypothetical protein
MSPLTLLRVELNAAMVLSFARAFFFFLGYVDVCSMQRAAKLMWPA